MMYSTGCRYCGYGVADHTACPNQQTQFISTGTTIVCTGTITVTSVGYFGTLDLPKPKPEKSYLKFNKQRVPKVIKK